VLHWFEHNLPVVASDGDGGRDYAAEAKLLACRLLEEQCGTVALLLTSMSKVTRDLQLSLAVALMCSVVLFTLTANAYYVLAA
jgi:hypothetical protein